MKKAVFMPVQTTDYTCGPTALIAAARIVGIPFEHTEHTLSESLGTVPGDGTSLRAMGEFACQRLGAHDFGPVENWDGRQVMVAVIDAPEAFPNSNSTHAVAVLWTDGDGNVVWWCQKTAAVLRAPPERFRWHSSDRSYVRWGIRFPFFHTADEVEAVASSLVPDIG